MGAGDILENRNAVGAGLIGRFGKDAAYLTLVSILWVVAILLIDPRGEYPVADDWAYTHSVRTLLESGHLKFSDWNATNLFTQVFWGAFVGAIFGPSNFVLRMSTLVLAWVGAVAFYHLMRSARCAPEPALLATLALLFNPQSMLFSFSFMTDVPYTTLQIVAMWLLALGMLAGSYRTQIAGWGVAVGALLIRQVGFSIPVGLAGEALVRKRLTIRTVALALLPIVAFFAGQAAFQSWLRASGIAPAMFGRQIPSAAALLAHPFATLRDLFAVFVMFSLDLGLFALPLSVLAAGAVLRRVGRRSAMALISAVAGVAMIAVLVIVGLKLHMPVGLRSAFVPDFTGSPMPTWVAIPLVAVALFGTILLYFAVAAAMLTWYRRERTDRFDIAIFALVMALCLLAPLPFTPLKLDRYLIPIVPCVLLVLAELFREQASQRRSVVAAGFVTAAIFVIASVLATHDSMAMKRAQWAAFTDLTRHVARNHVDAGWVINGSVSYGKHGRLDWMVDWFAADDYVIDPGARPGFRTIAQYPVDAWLPWIWAGRPILVQQKVAVPPHPRTAAQRETLLRTAPRAARILRQRDRPEPKRQRVDQQQLARAIVAKADDRAHRLQRGEAAQHPGHCAEHAEIGAAVARRIGGVADEAAIAWLVRLPAAEHAELALELPDRRRDERDARGVCRVGDGEPRRETVGAIEHNVRSRDQVGSIVYGEALCVQIQRDMRVDSGRALCRSGHFRRADIGVAKQRLALQVRQIDCIVVDQD